MTTIIGIDPGSRFTGYGIIKIQANSTQHIAHGCIKLSAKCFMTRMQLLFTELQVIIQQYQPNEAAIEQVFIYENPASALKLGQARGAAIVALQIPVAEYSARQVKQSVVGYGAAAKEQVQHMVCRILNLTMTPQADAADALAIALCHAHSRLGLVKQSTTRRKSSSWRHVKID